MKQKIIWLSLLIFFASCDFTTSVHRDILKAQEFLLDKKYDDAIAVYKSVIEKRVKKELRVKITYQLADIYENQKQDYIKAIEYYKKTLDFSAGIIWQVKAYERLSDIYFNYLKDYEKSLKIYKKLYSFMPSLERNDFYEFMAAKSNLELRKYNEASLGFNKIIKNNIHRYYSDALYNLGLISYYEKSWKKAIGAWDLFIKKSEDNDSKLIQAKYLMANSFEMLEDLDKAYKIYYSLLPVYPNAKVIEERLRSIYDRKKARKR